jgi:hypothetical protein
MAGTMTNIRSIRARAMTAQLRCCLLCLLPALCSLPLQAQVQGTLFTTPEQRAYLDYLRTEYQARSGDRGFDIQQTDVPEIPTNTVAQAAAPQVFTLGGIMARREGGYVIWLNGRSFTETELPAGISLQRNEGVLGLRFTTNGRARFIKPGQTIELNAGVVQEAWERPQSRVAVLVESAEEESEIFESETETPAASDSIDAAGAGDEG